ncbi:hypothetical protein QQP08_006111 [Theobroma cacao]|nr:hypothetical protein QQP08_006111 [Theobroma cacao]
MFTTPANSRNTNEIFLRENSVVMDPATAPKNPTTMNPTRGAGGQGRDGPWWRRHHRRFE